MKKISTVLGVAVAAISMNAQTNLIQNSGFESWDAAAGTTPAKPTGWYLGTSGSVEQETATVHSGASSAKNVAPTASGNASISQDVAAKENTQYTLGYWILDNDANARGRHWVQARTASANITWSSAFQPSTYSSDSPAWTYVTATATTPANTTVLRFDYRTYGQNSTAGVIYLDDVVLVEGTLATGEVTVSKHALIKNTVVEGDLTFATKSSVQILDMNGKVVRTANVLENSKLNVSSLPKGVYFVKGDANGEPSVQKFIKR